MRAIIPARSSNSNSQSLFRDFDHLFESFFEHKQNKSLNLACDIEESEKFILFTFDLPGLHEDDFNIEVKDSVLTVSGERTDSKSEETSRRYRGRNFGSFSQSFSLPRVVNQNSVEADYTNGVLKILLPKKEEAQPRKIEVKTSKGGILSDLLKKPKES